jgi:hypothetical protein
MHTDTHGACCRGICDYADRGPSSRDTPEGYYDASSKKTEENLNVPVVQDDACADCPRSGPRSRGGLPSLAGLNTPLRILRSFNTSINEGVNDHRPFTLAHYLGRWRY